MTGRSRGEGGMMSSAELARTALRAQVCFVQKEHVRNVQGVEIGEEAAASTGAPRLWVAGFLKV